MTDNIVLGHAPPPEHGADCGCCEGVTANVTPVVTNRAGLSAVAYRIGTHADFKRSMLARLSATEYPALAHLGTRDDDDFTIALLDAWATVADVLTFYQERIANESYLSTATERRSILELAQLIGYKLNPGVAAETHLAFTIDDKSQITETTITERTRVQSIPGPGEEAQTFETIEDLVARPEWNALIARKTEAIKPTQKGAWFTYVKGVANDLKPGDAILLVGPERKAKKDNENWDFRRLVKVETDPDNDRTRIEWSPGLGSVSPDKLPSTDPEIYVFRLRASLFGYNAPHPNVLPTETRTRYGFSSSSTADWSFTITDGTVDLDSVYAGIAKDSWVVLSKPDYQEVYAATQVTEGGRSDYAMSSRTTRLVLDGHNFDLFDHSDYRETAVFAQAQPLEFAEVPLITPVWGDSVTIDRPLSGLDEGRFMVVRGKRAKRRVKSSGLVLTSDEDPPTTNALDVGELVTLLAAPKDIPNSSSKLWTILTGSSFEGTLTAPFSAFDDARADKEDPEAAEVVTLKRVEQEDELHARLVFERPLENAYDRATTSVLGNVAVATHGETLSEVLGSGDASRPHQRFVLKGKPLTYVGSSDPSGGTSTLEVRVDDVRWKEVRALYGAASNERVFMTDIDDEGNTIVRFGDGKSGARVPTGAENVQARYRKGIGFGGNVADGRLTTLLAQPLGVRGVTNPVAAEGGADPESREDARSNAPFTVMSLERVVSLQDYADFARAFAGVAKAQATWLWKRTTRSVFITVAGPNGTAITPDGPVHDRLLTALRGSGDPNVLVDVGSYRSVPFRLELKIKVDRDHMQEKVFAEAEAALRAKFGFDVRGFGQPVTLSEVFEIMHSVDGVVAVGIDKLFRTKPPNATAIRHPRLPAALAELNTNDQMLAAELLTLDPRPLAIGVMP